MVWINRINATLMVAAGLDDVSIKWCVTPLKDIQTISWLAGHIPELYSRHFVPVKYQKKKQKQKKNNTTIKLTVSIAKHQSISIKFHFWLPWTDGWNKLENGQWHVKDI